MKKINHCFDKSTIELLKSLKNANFDKLQCDEFTFRQAFYGTVALYVGNRCFELSNLTETTDYFGTQEDVGQFKFRELINEVYTPYTDGKQMTISRKERISHIILVYENQQLFESGNQIYDVDLVRGIILEFSDSYQFGFEKSIWFSEIIEFHRGYNVIQDFRDCKEFENDWQDPYNGKCSRCMIEL